MFVHTPDICADQEFTFDVSFKKLPLLPMFTSANLWHPSPCGIEQCHVIQYDMAYVGSGLANYSTHFKFVSS